VDKPGKTGALMPVEEALQRLLEMAEARRFASSRYCPWPRVMAAYWRRI